jgi:hypothetical protein
MPFYNMLIIIVLCKLCLRLLVIYEQLTNRLLVFQD